MKDQWTKKNIDLALLSHEVKQFFAENQFEVELKQTPIGYRFEASNIQLKITVILYGQPNDFTIEFIPSKKTKGFSAAMVIGYITSVFGGGSLLLRDIKLQEAVNKLEQIFWDRIDRKVAELTNSAKTTTIE